MFLGLVIGFLGGLFAASAIALFLCRALPRADDFREGYDE